MKIYKKWWLWVIVLVILTIIITKGCDMEIIKNFTIASDLEMDSYDTENNARAMLDIPQSFEELIILFTGEEGADEGWVLDMECLIPIETTWDNCCTACEFGSCGTLDACTDDCYEVEGACGILYSCQDDCYEVEDYYTCYDNCFYDLYDDCHACFTGCDTLYAHDCNSCYDACDETAEELVEDCWYYASDEIYMWDGSPIDDMGVFYEDNFPMFVMQFRDACTWFGMGFWSTGEDHIGCHLLRFGEDFCDVEALITFGTVCETIGGTYTCSEGEISCVSEG